MSLFMIRTLKHMVMVWELAETKYTIQREIADIKQILEYVNYSESQRSFLQKRLNELEKKLEKDERIPD